MMKSNIQNGGSYDKIGGIAIDSCRTS